MTEKINRRQFLGAVGATGLSSGLAVTPGSANKASEEVSVTDVGIIHQLTANIPDDFHLYTYARDYSPKARSWDKKFVLNKHTPEKVTHKLKNSSRVFRGKSLHSSEMNLGNLGYHYIPIRVSPTLGATTLVHSEDSLPTPEARITSPAGSGFVTLMGPDIDSPDSLLKLDKGEAKSIPTSSFTRKVKITKLDEDYNRVTDWVSCDIQRHIMAANRGKFKILETENGVV